MRHSLNEIEVLVRKAAAGSGYPYGLAEDIGRAGAWLCACGLDGVSACLTGIATEADGLRPVVRNSGVPTLVDVSIARYGPSALDLLMSNLETGEVRLINADVPLLLVGLAGVVADTWHTQIAFQFANEGTVVVGPAGIDIAGALPNGSADVTLVRQEYNGAAEGEALPARRSPADGFDVDEDLWNQVLALAARTYVAASDLAPGAPVPAISTTTEMRNGA